MDTKDLVCERAMRLSTAVPRAIDLSTFFRRLYRCKTYSFFAFALAYSGPIDTS